ncbi:shikimate dehydrogenase [Rhizobium mongolense]|uniref:Shikimate dehydrogenase n=1 Tax=Rhizobium mongolense TaxID=57676 RepID=A0ABR6IFU8_9HYPH|nr:shikimate dehydrogenase [Rhizobium mongolense]
MTVPNETTKRAVLVGLIGADIQMSKSPALHEREGVLQGLDYRYELLDLAKRGLPATALALNFVIS